MKYRGVLAPMLALCWLALLQGCSESQPPPGQPKLGAVSARVIDGSVGPVEGVEIMLAPTNMVLKTDEDGRVIFEVPPGEYFVDAKVCCVGPGFIEYHLPVTVRANETTRVDLQSCLVCL